MSGVFLSLEVERNVTAQQMLLMIQAEPELGLTKASEQVGQPIFALWMCSPQLEVQLQPFHRPLEIAHNWNRYLSKYGSWMGKVDEEPILHFRRNIFLSRYDEEQIKEAKILEYLYAEAKHNLLSGKLND